MLLEDVSSSVECLEFFGGYRQKVRVILLSDYPRLKHLKIGEKSLRHVHVFEAVNHSCIESIEIEGGSCVGRHIDNKYSGGSFRIQNCPKLISLISTSSSFISYNTFQLKSSEIGLSKN